jgi:hypothetical protein
MNSAILAVPDVGGVIFDYPVKNQKDCHCDPGLDPGEAISPFLTY